MAGGERNKRGHNFPMGISLKVNLVAQPEFEHVTRMSKSNATWNPPLVESQSHIYIRVWGG